MQENWKVWLLTNLPAVEKVSFICGFIPLLCCVISKCDIYQIQWKMRKNIPYCIRFLKGIFVMLHTAVQVPVWCTGQSNILWCLCIMLPEQSSQPIACPKQLLAFASFKILEIIIEKALEISQFCTSLFACHLSHLFNKAKF